MTAGRAFAVIALSCGLVWVAAGCGSAHSRSAIAVRVTLTTYTGAGTRHQTSSYTLGCRPTSGTLPFAARVCADIARHPQPLLDPLPSRTACAGYVVQQIGVSATWKGKTARFGGLPGCGWPGGVGPAVYYAAAERDRHLLGLAERRLRCDDDPTLLTRPTPYASVFACTHNLWTPRTERLIRIAERLPAIAALGRHLFPTEIGARRCLILAGGFTRQTPLRGLCGVTVKDVWSTPTVTFVETWPRTATAHARATFTVAVTNGRARLTARGGAVPPTAPPLT